MMTMISTCAMMPLSGMRTKTPISFLTLDYKPIQSPPPEEAVTHNNEMFVMADKLDWTEIFEETNHPTLPDMTPIPFTGEREEFDVNITEGEMNNMKDSNGTIRFMNVMRWCPTI